LGSPQGPNIIDWPKILAVGIVSPAATVVTSRFGVAGTLLGLALSAVFITAAVDVLKVYLARIPGAVTTTIPAGGLRKKPILRRVFERTKVPFGKFASLPRARRRSILMRGVVAAGVSIVVGLIVVTALEFGVGKSLSCWVWEECPEEPSAEGGSGRTARASTLPSVLGGGQRAGGSSSVPQEEEEEEEEEEDGPSDLRQQQPGVRQQQPGVQQQPGSSPGTPPQAPSQQAPPPPPRPAAADPSVQRQQQPGQRQGPSGVPTGEEQQQAPPGAAPEDQQQPTPGAAPEEEQPLGEGEQPPGAANP
jgi:hypothetical protein